MAAITKIWALDASEKVARDDINHWGVTSVYNACGSGTSTGNTVNLFGGRNEIVSFQLILETRGTGSSGVNVSLSSLTASNFEISNTGWSGSAKVGYVAGSTSGMTGYWDYVGRNIELFVASYINIPYSRILDSGDNQGEGNGNWSWNNRPAASGDSRVSSSKDYYFGRYIPDALVPIEAPSGNSSSAVFSEGVKGGAPFFINPNQNQTIWVDVYVPRNAATGTYNGVIKVTENNGSAVSSIPVSLRVYNFTLSDVSHFRQYFQMEGSLIQNTAKSTASGGLTSNSQVWEYLGRHAKLFKRHRADLTPTLDAADWLMPGTMSSPNAQSYFNGKLFTSISGYDGPGASAGMRAYPIGMYAEGDGVYRSWSMSKAGFSASSQAAYQSAADTWVNLETSSSAAYAGYPSTEFYYYSSDEPPHDSDIFNSSEAIHKKITWMRTSSGSGKKIKTIQTHEGLNNVEGIDPANVYGGPLTGYIDMYLPASRLGGDYFGQANGQKYPYGYCTTAGDKYRTYSNTATGVNFKAGTYNGNAMNCGGDIEAIDSEAARTRKYGWSFWKYNLDMWLLWTVSYRADNWSRNVWTVGAASSWGGGIVVYEGENYQISSDDHNIPGPISSIRLKNWRQTMQDYEYLWLCSANNISTTSTVNSVLTADFDNVTKTYSTGHFYDQPIQFATRGFDYENARKTLALALDPTGSGSTGSTGSPSDTTYVGWLQDSQQRYGNTVRQLQINSRFIQDQATAELSLKKFCDWLAFKRLIITMKLVPNLNTMALEIGDQIKISNSILTNTFNNSAIFMITGITNPAVNTTTDPFITVTCIEMPSQYTGLH